MEYQKPWLSVDDQVVLLASRGVEIDDRADAALLLRNVGYYRLSGYLYPFRALERADRYRPGTRLSDVELLIEFDRRLRLLVLEGVELLEVAVRTHVAHALGRRSAFAHGDPTYFVDAFVESGRHTAWIERAERRQSESDDAFVTHFRDKYDSRMPIWALVEVLELGQLARLYAGLRNDVATEIARELGVPTKRLLASWLATINYVRNVSAHHARLFNRKLVTAPKRPSPRAEPLLAHLTHDVAPKQFGTYNALAVMAVLARTIDPCGTWPARVAQQLRTFPRAQHLDVGSVGALPRWLDEPLWS